MVSFIQNMVIFDLFSSVEKEMLFFFPPATGRNAFVELAENFYFCRTGR